MNPVATATINTSVVANGSTPSRMMLTSTRIMVGGLTSGLKPLVTALAALTMILVLVSIILLGVEPLATTLVLIVAVATGFMAFYLHRTL